MLIPPVPNKPAPQNDVPAEPKNKGLFGWLAGGVISAASWTASATIGLAKWGIKKITVDPVLYGIHKYIASLSGTFDKDLTIANLKRIMVQNNPDSQLLGLYEWVAPQILGKVCSKLANELSGSFLEPHQTLLQDLVEINLAKGFANLSELVERNKDSIPNYDKQPFFVSMLSYLCSQGSSHISKERLEQLEEKYRNNKALFSSRSKELFPEAEKQELINEFIHKKTDNEVELSQIFARLIKDKDFTEEQIEEFKNLLFSIRDRNAAYSELFATLSNDILASVFPNKFASMLIPGKIPQLVQHERLQNYIYNHYLIPPMGDFLKELYLSVERDGAQTQKWTHTLQEKVGEDIDVNPIIQAPENFLVELAKKWIKPASAAAAIAEPLMGDVAADPLVLEAAISPDRLPKQEFGKTLLDSAQVLLHTEDPNLSGLGQFIQGMTSQVTLALMAKGTELAIPGEEKIDPKKFLPVLMERAINKLQSWEIEGKIPDQFWNNLFDDVPLPPLLKDFLVPKLIEQLSSFLLTVINAKKTRIALEQKSGSKFLGALSKGLSKDLLQFVLSGALVTPEKISALLTEKFPALPLPLRQKMTADLDTFLHQFPQIEGSGFSFVDAYLESVLMNIFLQIAEKNPPKEGKDTLIVLAEHLLEVTARKYQEAKASGKSFEEAAVEFNDAILKEVLGINSADTLEGLPLPLQELAWNMIKGQISEVLLEIKKSVQVSNEAKIVGKKEGLPTAMDRHTKQLADDIAHMVVDSVPQVLTEMTGEKMRITIKAERNIEIMLEELARGESSLAKVLLEYTGGAALESALESPLKAIAEPGAFPEEKELAADFLSGLLLTPLQEAIQRITTFEEKHGEAFNQELFANILQVAAGHFKRTRESKEGIDSEEKLHPAVPTAPVTYDASIRLIMTRLYGENLSPLAIKIEDMRNMIDKFIADEAKGVKIITMQELLDEINKLHATKNGPPLSAEQLKALAAKDEEGFTLRDIIRKEAEAPEKQRYDAFYRPAIDSVLSLLFPKGKDSLDMVPKAFREQAWNIIRTNLFPIVLPMMTELLLDPGMIRLIVLKTMQTAQETLQEDIVIKPEDLETPPETPLDKLDLAAGALVTEALKGMTLPNWMKKFVSDPVTGAVTPGIQRALGATLRSQFNSTFIKDKLELAFSKMTVRDEKGDHVLKFDPKVKSVEEKKQEEVKMDKELEEAFKGVVDVSISYFIKKQWALFQAKFDTLIENNLGEIGSKMKKVLDVIFRFVFFKIVGTILSLIFTPIKGIVKEGIYRLISLHENREALISMLTQEENKPINGPAPLNEHLLFTVAETIKRTVDEFVAKELVVPQPAE